MPGRLMPLSQGEREEPRNKAHTQTHMRLSRMTWFGLVSMARFDQRESMPAQTGGKSKTATTPEMTESAGTCV